MLQKMVFFSEIPGGWLTNRFGFKRVFGLSMAFASALTLLTPLAASQGLWCLIACRVVLGFCHGVVFPAMHGAWTHWAHPEVVIRFLLCFYCYCCFCYCCCFRRC